LTLKRQRLQTLGLLALALALVLHLGCPKCSEILISAMLQGSEEAQAQVVAVEWSRNGGDFQPCRSLGYNGLYDCGEPVLWGACGPDTEVYEGEYTIRALDADSNEVQEMVTVGRITCTTNHTATLDVSAFLVTP
jgi:hypothetical protein